MKLVSKLFSSFRLRGMEFKNRIFVSPMCQYSSEDGLPNHWHLVHASRAVVALPCCYGLKAKVLWPVQYRGRRTKPQDFKRVLVLRCKTSVRPS